MGNTICQAEIFSVEIYDVSRKNDKTDPWVNFLIPVLNSISRQEKDNEDSTEGRNSLGFGMIDYYPHEVILRSSLRIGSFEFKKGDFEHLVPAMQQEKLQWLQESLGGNYCEESCKQILDVLSSHFKLILDPPMRPKSQPVVKASFYTSTKKTSVCNGLHPRKNFGCNFFRELFHRSDGGKKNSRNFSHE